MLNATVDLLQDQEAARCRFYRPDYQGVALRWENARAFGPHICAACMPGLPRKPSVHSARHMDLVRREFLACSELHARQVCAVGRPAKGTALVMKGT